MVLVYNTLSLFAKNMCLFTKNCIISCKSLAFIRKIYGFIRKRNFRMFRKQNKKQKTLAFICNVLRYIAKVKRFAKNYIQL